MNKKEFFSKKRVIGMVHLLPLPGNASYRGDNKEIEKRALEDAQVLIDSGVDAIMVENFYDWPQYSTEVSFAAYSLMLKIATEIRNMTDLPFGVNIEMNARVQEWTMAYAVGADFIRIEAFCDNRAGSFGMIEACSTGLMDLQKQLPSDTLIFSDVHTAETYGFPNVPINNCAQNCINHDSSAIIVTENDDNKRITVDDVKSMRERIGDFPIIVGAGVKPENVIGYFEAGANAVIVGRGFKTGERVDAKLVTDFMKIVHEHYN
ncbi:MAG: BtpA/SgcQ family protein [Erysipelotrichaceae bacterium]|nr:BtpA/SgcQ family protein [Erysipelotrichaceae bacterium]